MELTPAQLRVAGCLVEKAMTTPDNYPLTMNSLIAACNQTTNRDPVVQYEERIVDDALANLKSAGLARVVFSRGNRVDKYRHVLDEALRVSPAELAILGVLMLRGPQTVNELRTRTDRLHRFADLDEVESTLQGLAERPEPLVRLLERQPGQREARWTHVLGREATPPPANSPRSPAHTQTSVASSSEGDRIAALEARVARLEKLVAEGYKHGMTPGDDDDTDATPVPPPPADVAPSATGVVTGDDEEVREAPPSEDAGEA